MTSPAEPDPGEQPGGHRKRRAARRQAIEILYQADLTGRSPRDVAGQWQEAGRGVSGYAADLVAGVEANLGEIDALVGRSSEGWAVYRMPVVDRTILRVACHELRSGVPTAVAISEAVHAAKQLSTDDSGRFVNGVLGRVARELEAGPEGDPAAGSSPSADRAPEVAD